MKWWLVVLGLFLGGIGLILTYYYSVVSSGDLIREVVAVECEEMTARGAATPVDVSLELRSDMAPVVLDMAIDAFEPSDAVPSLSLDFVLRIEGPDGERRIRARASGNGSAIYPLETLVQVATGTHELRGAVPFDPLVKRLAIRVRANVILLGIGWVYTGFGLLVGCVLRDR